MALVQTDAVPYGRHQWQVAGAEHHTGNPVLINSMPEGDIEDLRMVFVLISHVGIHLLEDLIMGEPPIILRCVVALYQDEKFNPLIRNEIRQVVG